MSLLSRLRHPRTTVRWRLTLLYGGLFLVCGAALLAVTYKLVQNASVVAGPRAVFTAVPPSAHIHSQRPVVSPGSVLSPKLPPGTTRFLRSSGGRAVVNFVGAKQRIADLHQLEIESAIALAIMAIISGLLGWLVAGRVLRPLRTIADATQEISEINLHKRLALTGPRDELRELADTIDGLLERLEGAFDAQRRFVANASHELRTPLTAARALLEMVTSDPSATVATFKETCQQVLKENEFQEQLIGALLTLAQGQRGLDQHQLVDLGEIVSNVVDANQLDAAANGLELRSWVQRMTVSGDPRLLERLVSNLVQNAIRHNAPGGEVKVSVRAEPSTARLEVTNTGPAVPPQEVERLLQPFQRLSRERTAHGDGLGLGLSIVAAVASAHRAQLEIRAQEEGGLRVVVRFPLELVLEDFPEGITGQRVHELHPAGALERRESLGGELD